MLNQSINQHRSGPEEDANPVRSTLFAVSGPTLLSLGVALVVLSGAFRLTLAAQQAPPGAARSETPKTPEQIAAMRAAMNGVWDYNDDFSVDAATGRPEQAPLSATQRGRGAASGGRPGPGPAGGGGGGVNDEFERRALAMMIAERRSLVRDLLEVPERLTIRASATEVTLVDDLDRARTYPADNRLRKYQIGAAEFEARAKWDGVQFQKDIEGPNNFRMAETFFLNAEHTRLIVIVRIGDPKKPTEQFGVNRVYDRVK